MTDYQPPQQLRTAQILTAVLEDAIDQARYQPCSLYVEVFNGGSEGHVRGVRLEPNGYEGEPGPTVVIEVV